MYIGTVSGNLTELLIDDSTIRLISGHLIVAH